MSDRILITGSSGFIGNALAAHLGAAGREVHGLDARAGAQTQSVGDIDDRAFVESVFAAVRPRVVVHLAARTDLDETVGMSAYRANTDGVSTMVDVVSAASGAASVERVLWASSRLVFAIDHRPVDAYDYKPSTQYGVSKVVGEERVLAARDRLPPFAVFRPTSIWGPGCGEPYRPFFENVMRGRYVHIAGAHPRKQFGYIANSVHQLHRLIECDVAQLPHDPFMLGDYEALDLRVWADEIADAAGVRRPRTVPASAMRAAGKVGDVIAGTGRSFPVTSFRVNNLLTDMQYDMGALRAVVPDLPVDWRRGVAETVAWLRSEESRP